MFGFLKKPNARAEQIMAEYAIKRDLLLADRAHEDAVKLAHRRQEDWKMQSDYDKELSVAAGNYDND